MKSEDYGLKGAGKGLPDGSNDRQGQDRIADPVGAPDEDVFHLAGRKSFPASDF